MRFCPIPFFSRVTRHTVSRHWCIDGSNGSNGMTAPPEFRRSCEAMGRSRVCGGASSWSNQLHLRVEESLGEKLHLLRSEISRQIALVIETIIMTRS